MAVGSRRGVRAWVVLPVLAGLSGVLPAQAPQVVPIEQEAAIRALVEQYYAAYAAKDIEALASMWDDASADRAAALRGFNAFFQFQDYVFSNLRVTGVRAGELSSVRARVLVDASVTNTATKRTEEQSWVRNLTLRPSSGGWWIWRDVAAGDELLADLRALEGHEARLERLLGEHEIPAAVIKQTVEREAARAFAARDHANSIAFHLLSAALAERAEDSEGHAQACLNIGFVHQAQMDWPATLEWFQKALAGFEAAGNTERRAATEMNVGSALYALRRYDRAGDHYERALALFTELGEPGWLPTIRHNLGNIAYLRGHWDAALQHYRQAVVLLEAEAPGVPHGNAPASGIAAAQAAIGRVFKDQGDYPAALEAYGKALAGYLALNEASSTIQAHEAIGFVHRLEGDYASSLRQYFTAWRAAQALPANQRDRQVEANLLAQIGDVYALEQRYTTALDYLQRSLVLQQQAQSQEGIAAVLGGIGGMHFLLGRHEPALEHYREALAIRRALEQPRNAARLLAHIGLAQVAQEKPDEARESYEQSLEAANAGGDQAGAAIALVLLASAHLDSGGVDEALTLTRRSLDLAGGLDDLDLLAHVQMVLGGVRRARGEADEAKASLAASIATTERLHASGASAEGRFFNDGIAPYLSMVGLLVDQGAAEEAFLFLERARLALLREVLAGGTVVTKGLTRDEQQEERRLRSRVVSLQTQRQRAREQRDADASRVASLTVAVEEATAARDAFEQRLYAAHPGLQVLRARAEPVGWPEAAAGVVDAQTTLLAYAVTEARSYLFVISRPAAVASRPSPAASSGQPAGVDAPLALRVFTIDVKGADLARRVAEFRQRVAQPDADPVPLARELYDLLVKPAESLLSGKRRVLVVPGGALWGVPFQALMPADGRFLIEDRAVAYGSSVATLAAAGRTDRSRARPPGRLVVLGLADPGKPAVDRLALVRPERTFAPLPEAEREAQRIGAFFGRTRATIYTGAEARVERLLAAGKEATTVHIAARAILNDASALHSLVSFAPPSPGEEALVEAAAMLDWDLGARTVVLSRAQGDTGLDSAGAAATALGWSLFVAGSPSVVLSQWLVDDPGTTALMLAFHRALRAPAGQPGVRPSQALRTAVLPTLRGARRHPCHWAGFAVLGDVR